MLYKIAKYFLERRKSHVLLYTLNIKDDSADIHIIVHKLKDWLLKKANTEAMKISTRIRHNTRLLIIRRSDPSPTAQMNGFEHF